MKNICSIHSCGKTSRCKGLCSSHYQVSMDYANIRRSREISARGSSCSYCGSPYWLEFDHIDPTTKVLLSTRLFTTNKEARDKELKKCQLLCHECHVAKTIVDRKLHPEWFKVQLEPKPIVHGKYGSYSNNKCRCRLCSSAWAKYMKGRRKQKPVQRVIKVLP